MLKLYNAISWQKEEQCKTVHMFPDCVCHLISHHLGELDYVAVS